MDAKNKKTNALIILECIYCYDNLATRNNPKWIFKTKGDEQDFNKIKGICPKCIMKDLTIEGKVVYTDLTSQPDLEIDDRILKILDERYKKGLATYSKPLRTFNGRDVNQDLIEELADAVMYSWQGVMQGVVSRKIFNLTFALFKMVVDESNI